MGRYTGHLALGMGKASGATITVIPEEFEQGLSFKVLADTLEGSIIKRLASGKNYGVGVLAEGIASKFNEDELKEHETVEIDEFGRVRLSEINLGRLMKDIVKKRLKDRGIDLTIVHKTIGYELRAADPIPFDVEYTRNLGYGAVRFLFMGGTGSMIALYEGRLKAVPFVELADPKTGKTNLRYVDINSETFMVGREYMIRLEPGDFKGALLQKHARAGKMTNAEFKKRFSYLVKE
jgi:6-phosphofructokinase 1